MSPRPVPRALPPSNGIPTQRKQRHVANIKSQLKRIKTNRLATERNKAVKTEAKTWVRKFREAAASGDKDAAQDALKTASRSSKGRLQGCHPQEPGRQQEVGHGQEGRRSLSERRPRGARHRFR